MSLISLAVTLIVIGVLLWLVNTYIPMDGKIKKILNVVVGICVVVWLLYAFGILNHSGDIRDPRVQRNLRRVVAATGSGGRETRNRQQQDILATGHVSRSSEEASRAFEAARSDLAFNCQGPAAPNFSGSQGDKNSTEFTTWPFPPSFAR